jgi:hypothetical protein
VTCWALETLTVAPGRQAVEQLTTGMQTVWQAVTAAPSFTYWNRQSSTSVFRSRTTFPPSPVSPLTSYAFVPVRPPASVDQAEPVQDCSVNE